MANEFTTVELAEQFYNCRNANHSDYAPEFLSDLYEMHPFLKSVPFWNFQAIDDLGLIGDTDLIEALKYLHDHNLPTDIGDWSDDEKALMKLTLS